MGTGHSHDHGRPGRSRRGRRALSLALALIVAFMVAEFVGGIAFNSLALLADAGHMLTDAASLALALFAVWLAGRPATPARSFGFRRAEILAALANGVALVAVAIWVVIEAVGRLSAPPDVSGRGVLLIGVAGLLVNLVAAAVLHRGRGETLNMTAAYRHVLADAAGSAGVIAAALIVITTGWTRADPLISIGIAALICLGAWSIIRDAVRVLLEAAPAGIDPEEVGAAIAAVRGVREVHDLHVWEITSGFPALSAHVIVGDDQDCHERRRAVAAMLVERFAVTHATLQMDHRSGRPGFVPISDVSAPGAPPS